MRFHSLLVLAVLTCAIPLADAHITQTFPTPRTSSQKEGPCGAADSVRGPAQVFAPGETITVEWTETVEHPGHYRIAFDMDGEVFPLPNNPNDDFDVILVDQIEDRNVNGADRTYEQEITFPDVECDTCTLQLIQIMTTNVPYNSFYFQCADIELRGPDLPDAGAAGTPDAGASARDAGGGGGSASDAGNDDRVMPPVGGCGAGGGSGVWMTLFLLALLLASTRVREAKR